MCRNILLGLMAITLTVLGLGIVVVRYAGGLGLLIYVALLFIGLILLKGMLPHLFRYFVLSRIRKMGKGLHKAVVSQSSIVPAPPPANVDDYDEEDDSSEEYLALDDAGPFRPRREELTWNWVDVTITPQTNDPWYLSSLSFSRSKQERPSPPKGWGKLFSSLLDQSVITADVERWDGKRFVVHDVDAVIGPQRLRFRVGFAKDVQALSLHYFSIIELAEIPIPRLRIQADTKS